MEDENEIIYPIRRTIILEDGIEMDEFTYEDGYKCMASVGSDPPIVTNTYEIDQGPTDTEVIMAAIADLYELVGGL